MNHSCEYYIINPDHGKQLNYVSKLIRNVLILDSLEMSPFCYQHVVALARVPPPENGLI